MRKIVAIGGGEFKTRGTLPIDKEIIAANIDKSNFDINVTAGFINFKLHNNHLLLNITQRIYFFNLENRF